MSLAVLFLSQASTERRDPAFPSMLCSVFCPILWAAANGACSLLEQRTIMIENESVFMAFAGLVPDKSIF